MNVSIPLSTVLILAAAALAVYLAGRALLSARRTAERAIAALASATDAVVVATSTLAQARDALAPAADELRANMAGVPKLLEGIAKIGSIQVEIMQAQRAAVQQPGQIRHNTSNPARSVEDANAGWEMQQAMRAGMSPEEAAMRANPANGDSVWSNSMLDGWGR